MSDSSTFSDYKTLGEQGGVDALALVGHLMQKDAEHLASLQQSLYEGMEADRDRWRERALAAERTLLYAQNHLMAMFHDPGEDYFGDGP